MIKKAQEIMWNIRITYKIIFCKAMEVFYSCLALLCRKIYKSMNTDTESFNKHKNIQ